MAQRKPAKRKPATRRRTTKKRQQINKPTPWQLLPFVLVGVVLVVSLMNGVIFETWDIHVDWDTVFAKTQLEANPLPAQTLESHLNAIHFIDVGQADATLLQSNGEYCLVDAGEAQSEEALLGYLNRMGVTKLKLLVMSHPHADHIGSMSAVIEALDVEQILLPDFDKAPLPTTATFERVLDAISEKDIPTVTAEAGQSFAIGSAQLQVIAAGIETENYNNLSQVLFFNAQALTAILSGDGEKAVEADALLHDLPLAKVYKAGHHGSNTSNTADFLHAIRPQIVAISCGAENSYGHPHSEPMERFETVGAQIFRTDAQGSVVIAAETEGLKVYTTTAPQQDTKEAA